jgi:alpha-D-ribose-1-phosphate 5-kinase (ADP)
MFSSRAIAWGNRETAPKPALVAGGTNFAALVQSERLPGEHEKLRGGRCPALSGGSVANTAIGLARQRCDVRPVSAVGDDALGRLCLNTLRASGVHTALMYVNSSARKIGAHP